MARFARYLREEKYITTQDAGGIRKRWEYGRRLLMDGKAMSASRRSLKPGVMETLLGNAAAGGYKLSASEVKYRLQAARTYETEAQIAKILGDFDNWWRLIQAGFPPVEVSEEERESEPYDPRDADEKWRDFREEMERRKAENPGQLALFELPTYFDHANYGPRTPVSTLIAACDESERMTANFVKRDEERRAYVTELKSATDGNLDMTWYEAEGRRLGLKGLGLNSWDEFDEIIREFFGREDAEFPDDPEAEEDE